jgi:hypothetical protein
MYRFALALVLATPTFAMAGNCSVSGTAYDATGKPMRAVVRLIDLDTLQYTFSATDDHAAFSFNAALPQGGQRYRLDLVSAPTVVTGTHIPTRSILGMSDSFACGGGQLAHQDVRAQTD